MLKESESKVGDTVNFMIEQDFKKVVIEYPIPPSLSLQLKKKKLLKDFHNLPESRKKDILKYLSYIKTDATLEINI